MSHRLTLALVVLVTTLLTSAPHAGAAGVRVASAGAAVEGADVLPRTPAQQASAAAATLQLVNVERRARGLRALRAERRLALAAGRHGDDMVARGFFAHVAPGGGTLTARVRAAGWRPGRRWSLGENLFWGTKELGTPRATVRGWMESPPHRANVLQGRFRQLGVGVAAGTPVASAEAGGTYVANFGA